MIYLDWRSLGVSRSCHSHDLGMAEGRTTGTMVQPQLCMPYHTIWRRLFVFNMNNELKWPHMTTNNICLFLNVVHHPIWNIWDPAGLKAASNQSLFWGLTASADLEVCCNRPWSEQVPCVGVQRTVGWWWDPMRTYIACICPILETGAQAGKHFNKNMHKRNKTY